MKTKDPAKPKEPEPQTTERKTRLTVTLDPEIAAWLNTAPYLSDGKMSTSALVELALREYRNGLLKSQFTANFVLPLATGMVKRPPIVIKDPII